MNLNTFETKHGIIEVVSNNVEGKIIKSVLIDSQKLIDIELNKQQDAVVARTWIDFHDPKRDKPAADIMVFDLNKQGSSSSKTFTVEPLEVKQEQFIGLWILVNDKKAIYLSFEPEEDSFVAKIWADSQEAEVSKPADTTVLQMQDKVRTNMSLCHEYEELASSVDCGHEGCYDADNYSLLGTYTVSGTGFFVHVLCHTCNRESETGDGEFLLVKATFDGKELNEICEEELV